MTDIRLDARWEGEMRYIRRAYPKAVEAIEREAIAATDPAPLHPDDGHAHSWGCRRCGVDALAADTAPLDAAWREAEAVLPEGWRAWGVVALPGSVTAFVHGRGAYTSADGHPTPAAALRALAARLAKTRSEDS